MKRGELYNMVLEIMLTEPATRDDDNTLESEVCKRFNPAFASMNAVDFVNSRDTMGFPSRESIGRIRRMIQEAIPELQATEKCKRRRRKLETEWKEYCTR